MEGSVETEKRRILVDTKGLCYFCFKNVDCSPISQESHNNGPLSPTFLFNNVTKYLKMSGSDLSSFSSPPPSSMQEPNTLENCDVTVLQCFECSALTQRFSNVYQQLQGVKMHLNLIIKEMHELMVKAEKDETRAQEFQERLKIANGISDSDRDDPKRNSVEIFRQETIKKCTARIKDNKYLDVAVKRLDDETDNHYRSRLTTLEPAQPINVSTFVKIEFDESEAVDMFENENDEDIDDEDSQAAAFDALAEQDQEMQVQNFGVQFDDNDNIDNEEVNRALLAEARKRFLIPVHPDTKVETVIVRKKSERNHNGKLVHTYYCKLCQKTVRNRMEHFRAHARIDNHKCRHCHAAFLKSANLRLHLMASHYEQPFISLKSSQISDTNFKAVIKSVFDNLSAKRRRKGPAKVCNFCNQKVNRRSKADMDDHIVVSHFSQISSMITNALNKNSSSTYTPPSDEAQTTARSNNVEPRRNLQCDFCPGLFENKYRLQTHQILTHEQEVFSRHAPPGCDEDEVSAAVELSIEESVRNNSNSADGGLDCVYCHGHYVDFTKAKNHVLVSHFDQMVIQVKRNLTSTIQ